MAQADADACTCLPIATFPSRWDDSVDMGEETPRRPGEEEETQRIFGEQAARQQGREGCDARAAGRGSSSSPLVSKPAPRQPCGSGGRAGPHAQRAGAQAAAARRRGSGQEHWGRARCAERLGGRCRAGTAPQWRARRHCRLLSRQLPPALATALLRSRALRLHAPLPHIRPPVQNPARLATFLCPRPACRRAHAGHTGPCWQQGARSG